MAIYLFVCCVYVFSQEFMKATVDLADLLGLHLVMSRNAGKGEYKIMVAAMGWATAELVMSRSAVTLMLQWKQQSCFVRLLHLTACPTFTPQVSSSVGGSQRDRVWLEVHPDELWLQHQLGQCCLSACSYTDLDFCPICFNLICVKCCQTFWLNVSVTHPLLDVCYIAIICMIT